MRDWQPEFIALWQQGLAIREIAQRLGVPYGTVQSRAHRLQQQGKIQPRARGGAYPRQRALARQQTTEAPARAGPHLPAPTRAGVQQWTVRLSGNLIEILKVEAAKERLQPSHLLEAIIAGWWDARQRSARSSP